MFISTSTTDKCHCGTSETFGMAWNNVYYLISYLKYSRNKKIILLTSRAISQARLMKLSDEKEKKLVIIIYYFVVADLPFEPYLMQVHRQDR